MHSALPAAAVGRSRRRWAHKVYTSGETEMKSLGRVVIPTERYREISTEGKAKRLKLNTKEDGTGEEGQHLCSSRQVARLLLTLCNSMDCSTPGFSVLHHLPELVQTHVHQASQPSHPLSSLSPAFSLSQHQGLFQ